MKTWIEMTNQEWGVALAKRLGWHRTLEGHLYGWSLPDGRWFEEQTYSLTETWEGMGLVVAAMIEKGWFMEVKHYQSGLVSVVFDGKGGTFCAENWDHNEPAAVAEAAYKALEEGE